MKLSYDSVYILKTECDVAAKEAEPLLSQFNVFPNPVSDYAIIRIQPIESGEHTISIFNMQGQNMFRNKFYADKNGLTEIELNNLENYPPGVFMIMVEKDGRIATRKLVKI